MTTEQLKSIVDEHDTGGTIRDELADALEKTGYSDDDALAEAAPQETAETEQTEQTTETPQEDDKPDTETQDAPAKAKKKASTEDATDKSVPDSEAAQKPPEDADQEKTDQAKDSDEEESAAGPLTPPGTWSAEERAEFIDLPAKAQAAILRREGDRDRAFSQKQAELHKTAQRYAAMDQLLEPHRGNFALHGVDEVNLFRQYIAYDQLMTKDPIGCLKILARKAGVDLSNLNPEAEGEEVSPEIAKLRREVSDQRIQLSTSQTERKQSEDAAARQKQEGLIGHVNAFARTTDDAGNLKYPHFEELRADMGALISSAFNSGQHIDMDTAYQKALWGSPTHREALLTSKRHDEERQAAKDKKAHAAKAAKAGASVAGSPGGAEPPAAVGSVRQELEKAIAASS